MRKYLQVMSIAMAVLCAAGAARAQGGNIGSNSSPAANNQGRPLPGVNVAICQPLATTAASVTSNLAVLTMASNPVTAGFAAGMQMQVAGFTGGDTYFNGGTLTNGQITGGFTILSVTSTTITYALTHANASAATNGTALQEGNAITPCGGLSTVASDPALLNTITQPVTTDALGNWNAFAAAGLYYAQFYGAGVSTVVKQVVIPVGGLGGSVGGPLNIKGPDPWASAVANGATCNGTTDDTTSLNGLFSSIGVIGNEMRLEDNCNWVTPPSPFSTPTNWVTMHLRGRLNTGGTVSMAPLMLLEGDVPQRGPNVLFGFFAPQAPILPSSNSISPLVSFNSTIGSSVRNVALGGGGGTWTGIGFRMTSTPGMVFENVSAQTSSNTASPLVATGSFGLRIFRSQFSVGSGGTTPAITLQDNSANNDTIRAVHLDDIFMARQGLLIGGAAGTYGGPRDGFWLDNILTENLPGSGNSGHSINLDITNNSVSNLHIGNLYSADGTGCTLNTSSGTLQNSNTGIGTVEVIMPIGGGCVTGTNAVINLFAHTSGHLTTFFPAGFTRFWTGLALADGNTYMTAPIVCPAAVTNNSCGSQTLLASSATAARTATFPDAGGNVLLDTATQTLTNKTLTSPTSTGTDSGTETLTNKTLTSPTSTGTDSGTETLTNKTLTSPVINGTPSGTGIPTVTFKSGSGGGNYTGSNTTYASVDTTNLCAQITVPSGWKLSISASGVLESVTAAVAQSVALIDAGTTCAGGGTTLLNGTERTLTPPAAAVFDEGFSTQFVFIGDGAAHSISLAAKTSNAADNWGIQNTSTSAAPSLTFFLTPSN